MNKLKVLLLTMSIFIVSCVTCFADARVSAPNGKNYTYVKKYISEVGYEIHAYADEKFVLTTYNGRKAFGLASGKNFYYYMPYYEGGTSGYTSLDYCDGQYKLISANHVIEGADVIPPWIAPTTGEAIQEIVPTFWNQLETFLPIGITILVILLVVQLIPRLVAWFQ